MTRDEILSVLSDVLSNVKYKQHRGECECEGVKTDLWEILKHTSYGEEFADDAR